MNKQYKLTRNGAVPNIQRGGIAIPLDTNTFLLKGRKHRNGGIDIGKDLEAENGEILFYDNPVKPNNEYILSAQKMLNVGGKKVSPAEFVLMGGDKNIAFGMQQLENAKHGRGDFSKKNKAQTGTKIKVDNEYVQQQYNNNLQEAIDLGFNGKNAANYAINRTANNMQYIAPILDEVDVIGHQTGIKRKYIKDNGNKNIHFASHAQPIKESNESKIAAKMIGIPMVATQLAPTIPYIKNATNLYTKVNPKIRAAINSYFATDGLLNAASDNGVTKTKRLFKEGKYDKAIPSLLGDILDISGGIGFAADLAKITKKIYDVKKAFQMIDKPLSYVDMSAFNDGVEFIKKDVIPRIKKLQNIDVNISPSANNPKYFDDIDDVMSNMGGYYRPYTQEIRINPNSNMDRRSVAIHEIRHNLQYNANAIKNRNSKKELNEHINNFLNNKPIDYTNIPDVYGYTDNQQNILNDAYDVINESKLTIKESKDIAEKGATNTEFRGLISKLHNNAIGEQLDDIIKYYDDVKLLELLSKINGYGSNYVSKIIRDNELGIRSLHESVNKIKDALINVPIASTPIIVGNKLSNLDDNQLKFGGNRKLNTNYLARREQ